MVTETYFLKALAQVKNKHSLLEEKHSLLEDEHSRVKAAHSKLQEEHTKLRHERNDMEGETWLWRMENKSLQAEHKELQAEHSQWKAACASLVEEVERKVLEEEYLAYLEQEYGQTHWPVAKVAELEVEQERKLAEAKEREQALMNKVAALETTLKSEVASLQSTIQRKDDDFDCFRRSSKEATDKVVKQLAAAKAEAVKHQKASRTLRKAPENGTKTALTTTNLIKLRRPAKPVEVPANRQQRKAPVKLQEQRTSGVSSSGPSRSMTASSRISPKTTAKAATSKEAVVKPVPVQTLEDRMRKFELEMRQKVKSLQEQGQRLREKSSSYSSPPAVSRPMTMRSRTSTKTTPTPAKLLEVVDKSVKVPAQTPQRPVRQQELTKPKETKRAPAKATSTWAHYKSKRLESWSAATSSTSSSPEISPRSAA